MSWIKTTDQLPQDHEHVLIWYLRAGWDNSPGVYIGYYISSLDEFRVLGAMGDCRNFITHWMPMPDEPA